MAVSTFIHIVECTQNHFYLAQMKLYHETLPILSSTQSLATTFLLFVPMKLTTLGISFKWNHSVIVFL